jgi:hypothetical protein
MKLSDWPSVEVLVAARTHLINQRDHAPIQVVIGDCYQSPQFVEHVRSSIRLELRYQIEDVERRLRKLGVVID